MENVQAGKIRIKTHTLITDKKPEGYFIVNELKNYVGMVSNMIVESEKMPGV